MNIVIGIIITILLGLAWYIIDWNRRWDAFHLGYKEGLQDGINSTQGKDK